MPLPCRMHDKPAHSVTFCLCTGTRSGYTGRDPHCRATRETHRNPEVHAMRPSSLSSSLTFTLCLALAAPLAQAAGDGRDCRIGDVGRLFGDVQVVRAGTAHKPQTGESFCAGDRFRTGARGVAELKFRDGTAITVGKDADFAVLSWKERRFFRNEATFELLKGAFRSLTGAITSRRHRFEVKTAIATIGVRGTDFWGGLNLTPDSVDVVMLDGKGVYVKNDAGQVEISKAGEGVSVTRTHVPASSNKWADEKLKRAVETITP